MDNDGYLFDDLELPRLATPGEAATRFERVNGSTNPGMERARRLWEGWYERFPDRNGSLRTRFRGDDHNHDGAALELFLHELFTRLGLPVDVEPQLEGGGSPDFLVSGSGGAAYVEATYLKQPFPTPQLERPVMDAINELAEDVPLDIGLSLETKGALTRAPSLGRIKRSITEWINYLDPQIVSWERTLRTTISVDPEYGDWRLIVKAVPRGRSGSLIVIGPTRSEPFTMHNDLLRAVERKARKYRDLAFPLIVAADIADIGAEEVEEEVLFGRRAVRSLAKPAGNASPPVELVSTGKTLWYDHARGQARNRGLGALLMVHNLAPWTVANVSVCLYLNPYVEDQVPSKLKSFGFVSAAQGVLHRHEGSLTAREVMELPDDWPVMFDCANKEQIRTG